MSDIIRTTVTFVVVVLIAGAIIYLDDKHATHASVLPGSANVATSAAASPDAAARIAAKQGKYDIAKEFVNPSGFVNTDPFTMQSLIGKKVILVDFWTYSCINCIRTLPYVEAWYEKYKDAGLVVIGVHTPEFDFEKVLGNVEAAVKKFGITYPIVLDSDYGTWGAYENQYWPHEYLIDIDGFIADDHIGEGDYAETEMEIRKLLTERNAALGLSTSIPAGTVNPAATPINESMPLSPETYLGSARNGGDVSHTKGAWRIMPEYAETSSVGAKLLYDYEAQNVYLVASGEGGEAVLSVFLDGKPIPSSLRGGDVDLKGSLHVREDRLYSVVEGASWGQHTLQLILTSGAIEAFTFTFG